MINVVVPAYNCFQWLPSCLFTLMAQDHKDFTVCIVDDFSNENLQRDLIVDICRERNWAYILNDTHLGSLHNQFNAINLLSPKDEDIIVIVDGDDSLTRPDSLSIVQSYYDQGYLLTYGNYKNSDGTPTSVAEYPYEVVAKNRYRRCGKLLFNHLRTFSYSLYSQLDENDFKFSNGEWFQACADTAIMIPCLELAGGNYKFIDDVLYEYNVLNPISDWKVRAFEIERTHKYILNHLKRKKPLNGIQVKSL